VPSRKEFDNLKFYCTLGIGAPTERKALPKIVSSLDVFAGYPTELVTFPGTHHILRDNLGGDLSFLGPILAILKIISSLGLYTSCPAEYMTFPGTHNILRDNPVGDPS